MHKKRLYTPGPTPVPENVSLKMAQAMIHHRHDEFIQIFKNTQTKLNYLFQTKSNVLILTSSGTGALEAIVSNFTQNEDVIVVINGKFGQRWKEINELNGNRVFPILVDEGKSVRFEQIEELVKTNPSCSTVFITHSETSTGTANDIQTIAKLLKENYPKIRIAVDGITSIGSHEFRFDEWKIDYACTGSQKGLMLPPGLAFIAVSELGWEHHHKNRNYYFDLMKAKNAQADAQTPYTPSVSLIIGLNEALEMIQKEGIENTWNRHQILSDATRAAINEMGLKLFAESPSNAVTAVWAPENISSADIIKKMKSECGMTIANGQDEYKNKLFRISHLGYYDEFDIISVIAGLEKVLSQLNYPVNIGSASIKSMKTLWNK